MIVAGDRPALLGRNWLESIQLESIKLDWPSIRAVTVGTGVASVDDVVKQHLSVFKDDYGLIKDFKITIHLRPDTTPVFRKARPIPFARRETVAAELDRLEANRIITKVERSDWAAPTVNVLKPDKSISPQPRQAARWPARAALVAYRLSTNPTTHTPPYSAPYSRSADQITSCT